MWLQIFGMYWLVMSLIGLLSVNRILAKYHKKEIIKDPQYAGLIRQDFGKWPTAKLYFGAFAYFPFKFFLLLQFIFSCLFFLTVSQLFPSALKAKILRTFATVQLFLMGMIVRMEDHTVSSRVKTPILIANHVCWFDIVFLILKCWPLSFVAKAEMKKVPIVGTICRITQCILVNRQKESGRSETLDLIKERIEKFKELENQQNQEIKDAYPLAIFPEGTTTNGKVLIKFKHGAFQNLSPITAMCLTYKCDDFDMGMDEIRQLQHMVLMMCLKPSLEVKQFIINSQENQTVEEYAGRCKNEMATILQIEQSETGFREKLKLLEEGRKNNKSS